MSKVVGGILLALGGCAKPPSEPETLVMPPTEEEPEGRPVEPGPWSGQGVNVLVPETWVGREGHDSAVILELEHEATGTRLSFAWGAPDAPIPPERDGCQVHFTDQGRYRSVPMLSQPTTATCLPDDPEGPTIQGWYGEVGGRPLHVEAAYPPGAYMEGRQAVEPVLSTARHRP